MKSNQIPVCAGYETVKENLIPVAIKQQLEKVKELEAQNAVLREERDRLAALSYKLATALNDCVEYWPAQDVDDLQMLTAKWAKEDLSLTPHDASEMFRKKIIPDGFALVPIVPTGDMILAAIKEHISKDEAKTAWEVMIEAARSAGVEGEK